MAYTVKEIFRTLQGEFDAAIAMYDRGVAARVVERRALTADFPSRSLEYLRQLAGDHDLDYLVTDQRYELPLVYENATFRVYALDEVR